MDSGNLAELNQTRVSCRGSEEEAVADERDAGTWAGASVDGSTEAWRERGKR